MISVAEIRELGVEWQLREDVVEKDYVLGLLLSAIVGDEALAETWVFKGGTALRKCFFETPAGLFAGGLPRMERTP